MLRLGKIASQRDLADRECDGATRAGLEGEQAWNPPSVSYALSFSLAIRPETGTDAPDHSGCLGPPLDIELLENIVDVIFDGRGADPQASGDLFVGMPLVDKADNFELSVC